MWGRWRGDQRIRRGWGCSAWCRVLLLGMLGTRLWFLQGTQQAGVPGQGHRVEDAHRRTCRPSAAGSSTPRADAGRQPAGPDDRRRLVGDPQEEAIRDALFERLSGPLQTPGGRAAAALRPVYGAPAIPKCTKGQIYSPLLPLPLKEDVDEETVSFLAGAQRGLPGHRRRRSSGSAVYPYAPLASHVVGYMGAITKETRQLPGQGLQRQRARRPVRRRAEHGVGAPRHVGQAGLRDRRGRQRSSREDSTRRSSRSPARTCS